VARVLASARQTREQHALCFLDLDRFKDVNDRAGHQAGDELLRQLSALLREQMRTRDTLARVGGDEFAVLLEHCSAERAVRIAEALRRSVARFRFVWGDQSYGVGASIGIVAVSAGSGTVADVLRAADTACYVAKQRGRNRIQVYEPARRGSPRRRDHRWVQEIRRAVAEDRFRLYAQPILPLGRDGEPPRWEVLLRLVEPGGEPLLPDSFLPAAERYGLMGEVDAWVIRHTVAALATWQRANPGAEPPTVGLNLGRETIAAHDVVELVRAQLAATAVPPHTLCFEIAESALVAHPVATRRLARNLQALGCRVTLEHCGSGIAVFTLLKRLRLDYLKIAGHIVRDVARDPVDRALAAAVNEVGHLTGYRTVAVEVADADVLACVRELGVDYAQGFELGRPRPLEEALGLASPA
jgi:diguanylate cyclase (GGDEF)-like protein